MTHPDPKPVLLSGIQPTGALTIANYIGAVRSWANLQGTYDSLFLLVDLHALTVTPTPDELLRRSYEFVALFMACGIDPTRSRIFVQSHVPGHAELQWILNCITHLGELNRMTQFKEKTTRQKQVVNAGLYDYPVLMASDILLYETDLVPVGEDQIQHLELARRLAERFNSRYGEVFTIPQPYLPESGSRIMSLQDPTAKMSKTDSKPAGYIGLLDPPELVRKKIRRAVTDPGREVTPGPNKPGITNLLALYAAVSQSSISDVEALYFGRGYAELKDGLADRIINLLGPIQQEYRRLETDHGYIDQILYDGAQSARYRSESVMQKVRGAVGLIPRMASPTL